jgi:hypothetical protein
MEAPKENKKLKRKDLYYLLISAKWLLPYQKSTLKNLLGSLINKIRGII